VTPDSRIVLTSLSALVELGRIGRVLNVRTALDPHQAVELSAVELAAVLEFLDEGNERR